MVTKNNHFRGKKKHSFYFKQENLNRLLIKALKSSSFVVTAWDGNKLVGLIRALDDGEMVVFLHYLLVHPDYQGNGIAAHLLDTIKEKYKDYLYINIMPDERQNITFYQKHGFTLLEDGAAMQIRHL